MTKNELIRKLQDIKSQGFVPSTRSGTTGVGYTLETLLGIPESNIAVPDIGGRIEIKATRRHTNNLITLFTFNRGVWKVPQKEIIEKYGYKDAKGRMALKSTLFYNKLTTVNLLLNLKEQDNIIEIVDSLGNLVGSYDLYNIVGVYNTKLSRVLFCIADSKIENNMEFFYFSEFYLLSETSPRKFINAFKKGFIGIDLRLHLNPNGSVRNRGTGFRIKELYMKELYEKIERLL